MFEWKWRKITRKAQFHLHSRRWCRRYWNMLRISQCTTILLTRAMTSSPCIPTSPPETDLCPVNLPSTTWCRYCRTNPFYRILSKIHQEHRQCIWRITVWNWRKEPPRTAFWNGQRSTTHQNKRNDNILIPFGRAVIIFSISVIIYRNLWIPRRKVSLLLIVLWCTRIRRRLNDCCTLSIGPRITTAYMWIPRSVNFPLEVTRYFDGCRERFWLTSSSAHQ